MDQIRRITFEFKDKDNINEYFDSFEWIRSGPADYNELWKYIKKEKMSFFREL